MNNTLELGVKLCAETWKMMLRTLSVLLIIIVFPLHGKSQVFHRTVEKKDRTFVKKNSDLITADPKGKPVEPYFRLAQSLWELQRIEEAKILFFKIVESELVEYNEFYYFSSDLAYDTSSNLNEYETFSYNYKNSACLYLTEICIEQQKFEEAQSHLDAAINKYPTDYFCGTAYIYYFARLRHLKGLCFEGLGQTDKAIELLVPYCFRENNETLLRILKATFQHQELKEQMDTAIATIQITVDTIVSKSYINTEKGENIAITYTSGSGTIILYNQTVVLPRPKLGNGESVTSQHFIDAFLSSSFYQELINDKSPKGKFIKEEDKNRKKLRK